MNNKEIYDFFVKGGSDSITLRVICSSHVDGTIWDNGMYGGLEKVEIDEEGTEHECLVFHIREDSFRVANKPFMQNNYFDDNRIPTLNYIEADAFPENGVFKTYIMPEETTFELMDKNELLDEYIKLEESELSYTKWLENKMSSNDNSPYTRKKILSLLEESANQTEGCGCGDVTQLVDYFKANL